ncbi:MAG: DUF3658 domain-containing protein [Clostridiaceae bacterium]|nr:DUF3658 domain-containing protein [Clostridiaceae bacterium]
MIEVVFSDSEKGSMKCGQRFSSNAGGAVGIAIIRSDGGQPTKEEYAAALAEAKLRRERELRDGKPLGGRPEDVIGLSFALDIGDIAVPITDASRRSLLAQMLSADPWDQLHEIEDSIHRYWDGCISDLNKLITKAKAGEPIRIWYSNAPYSMCGFYDTIYNLESCDCRISAVKLPGFMPLGERGAKSAVSWGEITPGEFAHYLPLEFEIPDSVKKAVIMEWERLKGENAPLRVVLNGKLHSAEMDFYDCFIRKEIPDGTFKVGQLIGSVLGRNRLGIGDWLIAQRIRNMIESNELIIVQKNAAFYGTILKRI